jgi:hypothetical protein
MWGMESSSSGGKLSVHMGIGSLSHGSVRDNGHASGLGNNEKGLVLLVSSSLNHLFFRSKFIN